MVNLLQSVAVPIPAELLKSFARMNLDRAPVAVAFLSVPPAGLPHIGRPLPAGCAYWKIMLISEAARAAGIFESAAAMGRPACAMIPQAMTAAGLASVGCIGNRVYTGLGDDELYFAVPGKAARQVLEKLDVMLTANDALEAFHRQRATALA